jgi:hypothetical protein
MYSNFTSYPKKGSNCRELKAMTVATLHPEKNTNLIIQNKAFVGWRCKAQQTI